MNKLLYLFVLFIIVNYIKGDCYLHNPPGSNNRNRERNEAVQNDNRLFDSQNNNQGGYAWRGDPNIAAKPDPLVYYTGSELRIEWTNQHASGQNENVHGQIILQYGSESTMPGLRDGYPSGLNPKVDSDPGNPGQWYKYECEGDNRCIQDIESDFSPNNKTRRDEYYYKGMHGGIERGMHEGIDWYKNCSYRERNKGLYTADQNVGNNQGARRTRQNPNAERHGLECPEERDYYPYWYPTPWKDIAILTTNLAYCDYMQENSFNVKGLWYCDCDDQCRTDNGINENSGTKLKLTKDGCNQLQGASWKFWEPYNIDKPDCVLHQQVRDNHLGNAMNHYDDRGNLITAKNQPETPYYVWKIPDELAGELAIVRIRYNISTGDYESQSFQKKFSPGEEVEWFDAGNNCPNCYYMVEDLEDDTKLVADKSRQLITDPVVPIYPLHPQSTDSPTPDLLSNITRLALALDTDQTARTFQDRTFVFKVEDRPSGISSSAKIINLNLRGRRGNIVECYPSVEYDYVPSIIEMTSDDYVHIQIHGTDFNPALNANGEGWQYSSRANIIQIDHGASNFPMNRDNGPKWMFKDFDTAYYFAWQNQTGCKAYPAGGNDQNERSNCGKLNDAPRRFPPNPADGLMKLNTGTFYYMDSRNNNFSNRSNKGRITVEDTSLSATTIAAISVGVVGFVGLSVAGVCWYGYKHPDSKIGKMMNKNKS